MPTSAAGKAMIYAWVSSMNLGSQQRGRPSASVSSRRRTWGSIGPAITPGAALVLPGSPPYSQRAAKSAALPPGHHPGDLRRHPRVGGVLGGAAEVLDLRFLQH